MDFAAVDYRDPDAPAAFVAQEVLDELGTGRGDAPAARWWEGFDDALLDTLVEAGLEQSHAIAGAAARVAQARARVRQAGAADAPRVEATAEGDVEGRRELDAGEGTATRGVFGTVAAVLPLDVFGRTRRSVEAARANLDAARAALRGVVLATSAGIAGEYLRLRGNQRQLELLRESVHLQEQTLSIVRTRFRVGLSPEVDLQRAITSVENLRADIPLLEEALQGSRNRLATLTGQFPGAYETMLSAPADIPGYGAPVPSPVPLAVLDARPDVRQAEGDLREAIARIGVAEAEYYPAFALTGSIEIGTSAVTGGPATEVLIGSLGALVEQVVTAGGAREANVEIARARAREALAAYEEVLREAILEVELSLAALEASAARQESLAKAVKASERSFHQAEILYQQGLVSFLEVVDAQRELADAEQALASERTRYATEIATLFQALGTDVPEEAPWPEAGRQPPG